MRKLTTYLARLFATDALILTGIVCFLLWLVNCLRSFEVVSVKGQGFDTLAVQALFTMPPLLLSFFYICIGIGMVRALSALQTSHEMHIIHIGGGLGDLWRASLVVGGLAVAAVLLLAHVVEPLANKRVNTLAAEIAADLVSSTLKPDRFTQVTPGVVLLIGGRRAGGEVIEFFADDRRNPETRRTYVAERARVSSDGAFYVIELYNGALQYVEADGRYSEVRFARYDISVDSLSQPLAAGDPLSETDSFQMVRQAMETGEWTPEITKRLLDRSAEGLRVIAICLLALALAGFPSGRRTRVRLPLEAIVMLCGFAERGLSAYSPLGMGTGAVILILISGVVLAVRLWPRPIIEEPA